MLAFSAGAAFGQGGHGRARLTGIVMDGLGNPIAGARVVLRLIEAGETWLKRSDSTQRSDSAVFETQTDGKGAWSFNGLATGVWEVQVSKGESYGSGLRQVQVRQLSANPRVEIRLDNLRSGSNSLEPELLEDANTHYAKGEYGQALESFRAYLAKDPDAILVVLAVGDCLRELGRGEEAVETFRDAVDRTAVNPGDKELWARACSGLGDSFFKLGNRVRAVESWIKAAENSDWSEIPAINAAEVLFADGRAEESLRYFLIAARIAPEQAEIHYKLGLVYLNLDDYAGAKASFTRVVDLQPRTPLGRQARKMIADIAKRRSGRP